MVGAETANARLLNRRAIAAISYASFAMYLIHRLTLKTAVYLYSPTSAWIAMFYTHPEWDIGVTL